MFLALKIARLTCKPRRLPRGWVCLGPQRWDEVPYQPQENTGLPFHQTAVGGQKSHLGSAGEGAPPPLLSLCGLGPLHPCSSCAHRAHPSCLQALGCLPFRAKRSLSAFLSPAACLFVLPHPSPGSGGGVGRRGWLAALASAGCAFWTTAAGGISPLPPSPFFFLWSLPPRHFPRDH